MKTLYWVLAALILAFTGGWFVHAHYSAAKYTAAVAHADALQVVADSSEARLRRARDSVVVLDSLTRVQDSLNHTKIVGMAARELEIVDSIKKIPNIPPAVIGLIDSLIVTHQHDRTIWDNEVTLLQNKYHKEHTLRTQTEGVLMDTQQENAALRIAVNARPAQVVVGSPLIRDLLIVSTTLNLVQFAVHH